MGVMHFLVPRRDRVGADAAGRIYLAGIDEVPWLTRVRWTDQGLDVERLESDSGNLFVPYVVPGRGELMLSTASLMERSGPYHLHVELARGTLNRLRNQLAVLPGPVPADLAALVRKAHEKLSQAVTLRDDPQAAAELADRCLVTTLAAIDQLSAAIVAQSIGARRGVTGRLNTLMGVNLGCTRPNGALAKRLTAAFNTVQLPLNWREIESREGHRDFSLPDAQLEWARAAGMKICGGPLLSIDRWSLPDWMTISAPAWPNTSNRSWRDTAAEFICGSARPDSTSTTNSTIRKRKGCGWPC
jgi:hypothetical protein